MKKSTRQSLIVFGIVLLVGLALFFRDTILAAKILEKTAIQTLKAPESAKTTGPADSLPVATAKTSAGSSVTTEERIIPSATQDLIRNCLAKDSDLPRVHYSSELTLKNILQDLSGEAPPPPNEQSINVHVRKADGQVQRLHLTPFENGSANKTWRAGSWTVSLFDVDKEDLPVRVDIPESLKLDTANAVITNFLASGTLIFKERRYSQKLDANTSAEVVEENERIQSLQLFFGLNSLGCAWEQEQLNCQCLDSSEGDQGP